MKNSKDFLASYAKLLGFSLDVESIFNQSIPREGYQILGTDKRMILFSDLSGLRNGFNALCRSNFNDEKINKPSFGVRGVIERFSQINPKILFISVKLYYTARMFKIYFLISNVLKVQIISVIPCPDTGSRSNIFLLHKQFLYIV